MILDFGEYIRIHRKEKSLTLTQLAAKIGLDSANLSKIENGRRGFDEKRLEKLSMALEIDLETLKKEFYSDIIARKIFSLEFYDDVLGLAKHKVKYFKQKNSVQTNFKF